MTALEYELTSDDYLAYNIHTLAVSEAGRRQRLNYRLVLSVVAPLLSGLVIGFGLGDLVGGLVVAAFTGAILWFISPGMWNRAVRKSVARMATRDGLGNPGQHRLVLDDDGLREETANGVSSQSWQGIERVDETPEHAFIYFGPLAAFVIPKRIGEAAVAEFLTQVRSRIEACS